MLPVSSKRARQAYHELRSALEGAADSATAQADSAHILAQLRAHYTDAELRVAVRTLQQLAPAAVLAAALQGRL